LGLTVGRFSAGASDDSKGAAMGKPVGNLSSVAARYILVLLKLRGDLRFWMIGECAT